MSDKRVTRTWCEQCGKAVKDTNFEMIIGGPIYFFCSSTCMGEYAKVNL